MNKKIPMYKRIGTVFLCLSLLCGVIVGAGVFPQSSMTAQADVEPVVEKFEVDFADLAALVGNDKWNASTNRYRPGETDTAIQNWINSRFGLYICREGGGYKTYSFLGQSSFKTGVETSDSWSGEYWWEITKDGGLYSYTGGTGGQMLRKSNLLALKYADGELMQLSNFEANVVFNKADSKLGSVYLSFHQVEPGRMNTNTNTGTNTGNGTVAIVGNGPLTAYAGSDYQKVYKDGLTLGSLSGKDDRAMDLQFANDLELNVDYNLYVKVVGTKMTTKVTKVSDGSVVYSGETEIPEGNGYISVGTSNDKRVLKKIQVTELNSKGEPVNIGSTKAFKWTTSGKTGYANGKHTYNTEDTADDKDWFNFYDNENAGKADKTSIINALNANFDIYYNCEGTYYQMEAGKKAAYGSQTANYGYFSTVYEDVWLQRSVSGVGGSQKMRLITSLVPKMNGQALAFQNFDTTFKVRFDDAAASFVLGFRQQTPGKFTNAYFNVNKEQGIVVVTKTGITISGGEDIFSGHTSNVSKPGDMYDGNPTATFASSIPSIATIRVKAVGDQVTVSVYNDTTTFYSGTVTVPYTKAGYLAYGVGNRKSDLGAITLTHLDESGNVMATNEMTEVEEGLFAEAFALSFTDLPGAEYVSGKYTKTNQNWIYFSSFSDTLAIDHIKSKVDFYFNHEGTYGQVDPYGNDTAGEHNCGNWSLFYNKWLERGGSEGYGERLRQINAIIPKDANGVKAQMKNLSASFEVRFESDNGAYLFGFRQKNPGKFVNGFEAPNQEQVLIAITKNSIAVAGGADITKERFYHANEFADDEFGDVFTTQLTQESVVKVEAIGKKVVVDIYKSNGYTKQYHGEFTVNYTKEGYMAFGVSAAKGNLGNLKVKRLDDNGNGIDFTDDAYLEPSYPDGKTRFNADFRQLSKLVNSFSGGYYAPTADDTDINSWLLTRFGMYGMRETSHYAQLSYPGQLSSAWDGEADSKAAQWKITATNGLYMNLSGAHGEMFRKTQNLVLKTANGELAKLKNFEAEVVFSKGGAHLLGGMYISFHETTPGRFGADWKGNIDGAVVDAVIVGNGGAESADYNKAVADGITAGNIRNNNNKGMRTKFSANLDNSADYKLWVKVVGTTLEWSVTKVGETTPLASGTETIENTEAGYISIGARNREFKSILVTELDKNGKVVDFGTQTNQVAEKWTLSAIDLIEYKSSKYTATKENADGTPKLNPDGTPFAGYSYYNFVNGGTKVLDTHPDAAKVAAYLDSKVALYYDREGAYYQMEVGKKLAQEGQSGNTGAIDTLLYNRWFQKTGSYSGYENFRMINSMVPRNTLTGEELQFENFETTFDIRFESADAHRNTAIVGFRQAAPGKFTDGWWKINKSQAFVAITRAGITIAGGDQILTTRGEEGDMYNEDQTKFATTLPQEVTIYVKVVGDKVTVKITNIAKSTTYYDNSEEPATVARTGSGYLAYGLGSGNFNIGEITLARLNAEGEVVDVNGDDSVNGCPWDTSAGRYSESMKADEDVLEQLYDFYYSAMDNGTPKTVKEALDDHWAKVDGVLMRANDLGGNATEKLAMLGMKDVALKNFDAIFKLKLDSTQTGTFWVTARQSDTTKLGKVVSTPGQEDYVAGQLAVGLSVGGDVIIACGDADPIVIPGRSMGTPSGVYSFRVRVFGDKVEVYLNGSLRAARTIANMPMNEGALTFGYSGAELGIASVDIFRLNEEGAAVDMISDYVSVDNPTESFMVKANANFAVDLLPQLPATLTVHKKDGGSEQMNVYWDPASVDLSVEGDYKVVGYLDGTNGVRAAATVLVGAYDRDNTVVYTFDDATALEHFESWFMPTTRDPNLPALRTEGTANDGWTVTNGRLSQVNTGIRLSSAEYKEGKEINGVLYQDDRGHANYASNYSIAVLKDRTYENFILEVDVTPNSNWTLIGFGAKDWNDDMSVFPTQKDGGYSIHVEYNHGKNSGNAKFWGYDGVSDPKYGLYTTTISPYNPELLQPFHVRLVVSEGRAWYYVDECDVPFEIDIPDYYEGGYIYFASAAAGGGIDNLRITDLDAKAITITDVLTPAPAMQTIDRAAGESLSVSSTGSLLVADASGYEYRLPYSLVSETYRSNVEGEHVFDAVITGFHNMTVASTATYSVKVDNKINGDFDPNKTVKYYFDHPNDFKDFDSYYSQKETLVYPDPEYASLSNPSKDYTYYSAYNGDLVKADNPSDRWMIQNGELHTSYSFNNGGYSIANKSKEVSTLMLKKELGYNFTNYRIEVDYIHGGNFWYQYVIFGQQDPTTFVHEVHRADKEADRLPWAEWLATSGKLTVAGKQFTNTKYNSGVWAHIEQEGYFNLNGALDGSNEMRFTSDYSTTHIADYANYNSNKNCTGPKEKKHHMVITVVDGLISFQVDNSDIYYGSLNINASGGLIGLGGYGNSGGFDNLEITALDYTGAEVPIDEAPKGWKPEPKIDNYIGWQPAKDEWFFEWGSEYEKDLIQNVR